MNNTSSAAHVGVVGDSPGGSSVTGADAALCGICFCEVDPVDNPRGILNSCDHLFCLYCITTWAKDTNVCPHCKARFTRITSQGCDGDGAVVKVRRKNYRGWEEQYEQDDDEDQDNVAAAVLASVVCKMCHSGANAARMLFCDRRTCHFVAHLDCLGLREAPQTYVCPQCNREAAGERDVMRDALLAEELRQEITAEDRQRLMAQPPAQSMPIPAAVPRPSVAAVANVQAFPPAPAHRNDDDDDDGIPYYLKGPHNAHAELAQQQLQSRLDASAYQRQLKERQKSFRSHNTPQSSSTRAGDAARPVDRDPQSMVPTVAVPKPLVDSSEAETPAQMEHRLIKMFFRDQIIVVRRRHFIDRNRLDLVGEGHIAMRAAKPFEELNREDAMRVEALHIAQRMAKERMSSVHQAMKQREERALRLKATQEAHALAKLAEIIANHRVKELQALRDRARPRQLNGLGDCPAEQRLNVAAEQAKAESPPSNSAAVMVKKEPK